MAQVVDNLIAWRILSMLVIPFVDTDAYKLGIIDKNGDNLISSKNFKTQEQRDAYDYLHRLVFNLKKILNKLPGGESKLKNLVAAFFLVKEAYKTKSTTINEDKLEYILKLLDEGTLFEEQLLVEEFLLEDAPPVNAVGDGSAVAGLTGEPPIRKKRRFSKFVVNDDLYNKFATGKTKYRKWSHYLDLNNEGHQQIYEFAKKNPRGVIILQNGKNVKAIRFNRRGGGSWHKIQRKPK